MIRWSDRHKACIALWRWWQSHLVGDQGVCYQGCVCSWSKLIANLAIARNTHRVTTSIEIPMHVIQAGQRGKCKSILEDMSLKYRIFPQWVHFLSLHLFFLSQSAFCDHLNELDKLCKVIMVQIYASKPTVWKERFVSPKAVNVGFQARDSWNPS